MLNIRLRKRGVEVTKVYPGEEQVISVQDTIPNLQKKAKTASQGRKLN